MANPRVVVTRDPAAPTGTARFAEAKQANADAAEQIRQRRKQIHAQAATEVGMSPDPDIMPIDPPPEREDIDSIDIPLRDGRVVTYGPPHGVSLADRIARMYSGREHSVTEYRLTRILMGVRAIDGVPVRPIVNEIDRTAMANRIGDEAIDLLVYFDKEYWPPMTQADLPAIKKNLRGA